MIKKAMFQLICHRLVICLVLIVLKRYNINYKKKVLSDIFKYVTEIYYPNAKEYIFSVGYSSEPLEDLSKKFTFIFKIIMIKCFKIV